MGGRQKPHTKTPAPLPSFIAVLAPFLAQQGGEKHIIPGMDTRKEFKNYHDGGRVYINVFGDDPPCISDGPPTRSRLASGLPLEHVHDVPTLPFAHGPGREAVSWGAWATHAPYE